MVGGPSGRSAGPFSSRWRSDVRNLAELVLDAEGRQWLADRGVVTTTTEFRARLHPPEHPDLGQLAGVDADVLMPYVGHQLLADYRRSVTAKLRAAGELAAMEGVTPLALWLDTDRAGSDRGSMGLTWPLANRPAARLAPRRLRHHETRFLPVRGDDLLSMTDTVGVWVANDLNGPVRARAVQRLRQLTESIDDPTIITLAEANYALTMRLVGDHLGVTGPNVMSSRALEVPVVREALECCLNAIDEVVDVYNRALHTLLAADIDPRVRPLRAGYLPLRYACPDSGERLRLRLEKVRSDRFAVAPCTCGREHRFHLGSRRLVIDELAATGRWSTDVTLPVYLNDVVSGVIAGNSSGLYGLVLNAVTRGVLGSTPVPMLAAIPPQVPPDGADSLLYDFLTAP